MGAVFDGDAFGKTIVDAVNASIDRTIEPLIKRLEALETNMVAAQEIRKDLRGIVETVDAIPVVKDDAIRAMIVEECRDVRAALESTIGPEMQTALSVMVAEAVKGIPVPTAPELPDIASMVSEAVKALPAPKDGKDAEPVDMEAVKSMVGDAVKEAVDALPAPKDGKDADPVDMDAVKAEITDQVQVERVQLEKALAVDLPAMVKEAVDALPKPVDGKSVTVDEIRPVLADLVKEAVAEIEIEVPELPEWEPILEEQRRQVSEQVTNAFETFRRDAFKEIVAEIPAPKDGKSVTVDDVKPLLSDLVKEAVEALPAPKDGKDADPVDMDNVKSLIGDAVKEAVGALPLPKDGKDADPVDMDALARQIDEKLTVGMNHYRETVMAIPLPKDGKSITVDDVRPIIVDLVKETVGEIPVPKDGKDGADAMDCFIDKNGHLIVTFSTGKTKDVGQVVGDDGVDCDFVRVWQLIDEKLASWPKPKDGLGFDDMSVEYDGERTIKFVLERGDERREYVFDMPIPLYQGLFEDGKSYEKGDSVTWAGSVWIAQSNGATKKPGENNNEWRLAVKRGKPGQNGANHTPRENKPVQLGA